MEKRFADSPGLRLPAPDPGRPARSVVIEVADRGIGIAEPDRRHIFDEFFRAGGRRRKVTGSGLGLTLVHHIMEAHNGTIEVGSELGAGSTFRIVFPAASE